MKPRAGPRCTPAVRPSGPKPRSPPEPRHDHDHLHDPCPPRRRVRPAGCHGIRRLRQAAGSRSRARQGRLDDARRHGRRPRVDRGQADVRAGDQEAPATRDHAGHGHQDDGDRPVERPDRRHSLRPRHRQEKRGLGRSRQRQPGVSRGDGGEGPRPQDDEAPRLHAPSVDAQGLEGGRREDGRGRVLQGRRDGLRPLRRPRGDGARRARWRGGVGRRRQPAGRPHAARFDPRRPSGGDRSRHEVPGAEAGPWLPRRHGRERWDVVLSGPTRDELRRGGPAGRGGDGGHRGSGQAPIWGRQQGDDATD